MTGRMSNETDKTKSQAASSTAGVDARRLLEMATSNLGILSALVVIFAVSASIVFLFAYLSVFDWRLISFIEYTDVLKFGLVGLGVGSGVSAFLFVILLLVNAYTDLDRQEGRKLWIPSLVLGLAFLVAAKLYVDWNNEQQRSLDISLLTSLAFTLFAIFMLFRSVDTYRRAGLIAPGSLVAALVLTWIFIFAAALWGTTFGLFVRDSDGFKQDVTLKNEVLKDTGVVMVTPHHIILYSGWKTTVVPSSDLVKIEGGRR
jgi:hypothetical protein